MPTASLYTVLITFFGKKAPRRKYVAAVTVGLDPETIFCVEAAKMKRINNSPLRPVIAGRHALNGEVNGIHNSCDVLFANATPAVLYAAVVLR